MQNIVLTYVDPRIVSLMAQIFLAMGYSLLAAVYFLGGATH